MHILAVHLSCLLWAKKIVQSVFYRPSVECALCDGSFPCVSKIDDHLSQGGTNSKQSVQHEDNIELVGC